MVNPNIFRTYDIRGLADEDLTDEFVYKLGRAYGTYMSLKSKSERRKTKDGDEKRETKSEKQEMKVGIGQDVRLSSGRIAERLIQGIIDTGISVVDLGVVPTPLL